jgi:MFS family permease
LVAGLTVALRLPWLVFGLFSGAITDRVDRRRLMNRVNWFRAVVMGVLTAAIVLGFASIPLLYAVAVLLGTAETLFDTSAQAVIPAVAPKHLLEDANSTLFGTELVSNRFVGPPLGAALFGMAVAVPFLVDGLTFVGAGALLLLLPGTFKPENPSPARTNLGAEIKEGILWLWRHKVLRAMTLTASAMNLVLAATNAILVLYALELLGLSDAGFGVLLTGGGVGAGIGAVFATRITRVLGAGATILGAVLLSAVGYIAIAIVPNAPIVGVVLAVQSLGITVISIFMLAYRQRTVPDALLGRVTSGMRVVGFGALPLGAALGGAIASAYGLQIPYLLGGLALLVVAVVVRPNLNSAAITDASRISDT